MLCVDVNDENRVEKLSEGLKELLSGVKPVVLCVGCEKVLGDSLGPMVGSKLIEGVKGDVVVYGMMSGNVNAKNLMIASQMIKLLHEDRALIVVDAALGHKEEIGTIQLYSHGLFPGSATNKNLPCVGDVSIVGVVNQKICAFEMTMLYTAKQMMITNMAQTIFEALNRAFG